MAVYSTVNGQQTIASMTSQLQAVGYAGPWDENSVLAAYKNTTGSPVTVMGTATPTSTNPSAPSPTAADPNNPAAAAQQQYLEALASGNKAAADEAVRQFGMTFGLDQSKFQASVDQYAKNFGLAQAGITGTYNGQPTEAAREFATTANQAWAKMGLDALQTAAGMSGDPFAQQRYLFGLGQGGYSNAIDAASGVIPGVAAAGGPQGPSAAQGLNGLSNLASAVNGYAGGSPMSGAVAANTAAGGGFVAPGSAPMSPAVSSAPVGNTLVNPAPAPGVRSVSNAPGPNSPNDTARGTLAPGTTGMFQGASQNFGTGPGQGSTTLTGTRGTNVVGYDPVGHKLTFDYNFLHDPGRSVFTLVDRTTGGYVTPSNTDEASTAGTQGQTGWMSQPYLTGANGRATFSQLNDIDPSHMYRIQAALPGEGGGTGDAFEQDISGADILARTMQATPAAQQESAQMAGPTGVGSGFTAPSSTGVGLSGPGTANYNQTVAAMPNPNQVVARQFNQFDPSTQGFLLSGISAKTGLNQDTIKNQIQKTLPQFQAPNFGLATV